MQIGILEPDNFSEKTIDKLKNLGIVELFDEKNIDNFLINKNIIFIRLKYFIGKNFLDKSKKIQYICTPTTGNNHIDTSEAKKRKIKIISLKDEQEFLYTIRATPEHTFGLVLSLLRNYKYAFLGSENKEWNRDKYRGFEVFENTIGIIGFGRIGQILAKYFHCFGAKIYFYDKDSTVKESFTAKRVKTVKELIHKSNIILLCASFHTLNKSFINKDYFDLMKDKYFINTARGELIDEDYLIDKIKENHFKGIALDVISNESLKNNRLNEFLILTKNKNFIITPHIAGATFNSMRKTENFIVEKLIKEIH